MAATTGSPDQHLPLTPAAFSILLALADGEKHGYAIMQEAREYGAMGPGTLYGSLDRLLAAQLIVETRVDDDERRRFYKLTALGRRVVAAETARLEASVARARNKGVGRQEVRA